MSDAKQRYTIDDDVEPGSDVHIITQDGDVPIGCIYGFDRFLCFDPDDKSPEEAHAETVALAERFAWTVNHCAGLNPSAIGDVVAALEAMRQAASNDNRGMRDACDMADAALSRLKGTSEC